jgi:hypothetical protein
MVHVVSSPQATVQLVEPVQSTVHPPFGQAIKHVLLPPQPTVDPVSTFTLQLLPPPHVTVRCAIRGSDPCRKIGPRACHTLATTRAA